MENKSLEAIKDEYAREKFRGYSWDETLKSTAEVNKIPREVFKNIDRHIDEIATRYATQQTSELRDAALQYLDCVMNTKNLSERIKAQDHLRKILTKTQK